jgi:uncharacterized protein (UPF0335 family)
MVLLLLPLVLGSTLVQDAATLDLKYRPISKVVKLLKDMQAELNEEKAKDQAVFDKLTCWCETNMKEKTLATTVADKQITGLVSDIERLSAKAAGLKATIAQVKKEVASNTAALEQATKVRDKETAEFSEDEKDMMQSLQALKNAVFVLSKHHEATFMQTETDSTMQVRLAAEQVLRRADSLKTLKPSQRRVLKALVQQPNANAGSYTPQSGQIFGILSSMKEEFESNLSNEQKNEMQAASDFAGLKSAKEAEIDAGATKIKAQSQGLADAEEKLADAKESLEGTRGALAADAEVLSSLKLQCQQTDKDFALRQKTRSEEIAAVSEAIAILSDDDARDNFSKTLSFVQARSERHRGVALLRRAARVKGPRSAALTQLADRAQLDVFVKIRKSIDEMIASLKQEQVDEVKAKDTCVKEIRENEKAIAVKQRAITELSAFIEEAEATFKTLSKEIVEHKAEVKETQKQMAAASEEREAENKEFQDAVKEQRAAQDVLKKAKARLEAFYKKKQGLLQAQPQNLVQAVLGGHFVLYQGAQQPGAALSEKPKGFETFETKGKGAQGVLSLLSSIIKEAETMEKEALAAETDAQESYEEFIKGSNDSVSKLAALIASKTLEIAELTAATETAKADRSAALDDADRLVQTGVDLHKSCDFLVKNFDVRQAGRSQEMDALNEAKAVFSGADFA